MNSAVQDESVQEYVFDRGFLESSPLNDTVTSALPKFWGDEFEKPQKFFLLGPSGSSVSFHMHESAWNGVVSGSVAHLQLRSLPDVSVGSGFRRKAMVSLPTYKISARWSSLRRQTGRLSAPPVACRCPASA